MGLVWNISHFFPNITRMIKSRRVRWARCVERIEKKNAYRILVGNPREKRSVERPGRKSEDITNLREMDWSNMDWIHLAQHRDQ
jgi:hypothetical protein